MRISSAFDGGNIIVEQAAAASDIRLAIAKDNQSDFYQWFYFRLSGGRGQECRVTLTNAGGAAYAHGWQDYRVCASYDRELWFRIDTHYDGSALSWTHRPDKDAVYYAYFAPYSMERHADLVAEIAQAPGVRLTVLGSTLDGQDLDMLTIGAAGEGKKACWIIARQHPGETMAEWWMEGALERLTDPDDPVTKALLEKCVFYIVPNMNPDGSRRGHLRTNAVGANLNREWETPTAERSPEVLLVRNKMDETGVDFCLDVHGDEALPYNFIAGFDGVPSVTAHMEQALADYVAALARLSPDFQTTHGYPRAKPGEANMTMCTNQVAARFSCLAMTLEMPFKDNAERPDALEGWSPARARHLARACLDALHAVVDDLP
ncbi:MAG: M14 family metallopeptidase [Pseudomonadota bacterium]